MAVAAGALLASMIMAPVDADANGLQPVDLRVDGGEESWHAEPSFTVRWRNPISDPPVTAVHYRLLDPTGMSTLAESRIGWATTSIQPLTVPPIPGAYRAEVWLEDAAGAVGNPVRSELRFDDATPGRVEPQPVAGWISRNAFPLTLRLGPAVGAEPLAGIRGYATSLDRVPDGSPCADAVACAEAETDLLGAASRTLTVADLPEGTSYLHAVAVSGSGMRSAEVGSTALRVDETDPTTTLAGAGGGWSNRPLRLTATAVDEASGMAAGAGRSFTAIRIDGTAPVVADGDSVSATVIESGVHTVAYYARDAAGNVDDGGVLNGHRNREPRLAVARVDREPPHVAFANSQDPGDPELIEAPVTDALSGADPSRGTIAVRPLGSAEPFVALPTESVGGVLRARWDSSACPPGEYELRAVAYDRAGNPAPTIVRANGRPMRLQAPLKTKTTLSAELAGGSSRVAVPYGRRVVVRGRLIAGRRTPLAGTLVTIAERFAEGAASARRVTGVQTGPDGRFHLLLRPGSTREVVATAAATRTRRSASSGALRVEVRAGVRLEASARTARICVRPIVFSGRALGAGRASGPAVGSVELQFRLPGSPWSEFRTVRTNRRGRFRYAYRFADDDSRGVRFQFRAFVPAQAGWPFEPAGSTPVTVRGV